ncbi:MAG: hypothetical protein WD031_01365 [Gemmatimonadota bacterium]
MADIRTRADQRYQEALERTGARDPRDYYRDRLRDLRKRDSAAYRRAAAYFQEELVARVADDDQDAIGEWLEYGRLLASLTFDGVTVQIDPSGRSSPYRRPVPLESLVLHLPASRREAAMPIGLPPKLSPAQRATYDLLVTRMSP